MLDQTKPATSRGKPRNTKPGRPPFLADPRKERPGETIGGGFFVFRRTAKTGRIRVPEWPFEHPNRAAAEAERDRLASMHPNETFVVGETE
jgi:hypothetical protein